MWRFSWSSCSPCLTCLLSTVKLNWCSAFFPSCSQSYRSRRQIEDVSITFYKPLRLWWELMVVLVIPMETFRLVWTRSSRAMLTGRRGCCSSGAAPVRSTYRFSWVAFRWSSCSRAMQHKDCRHQLHHPTVKQTNKQTKRDENTVSWKIRT